MNTSSSAQAISENNIIVGTGVHNGEIHAYAMVPAGGPNADANSYCDSYTYSYSHAQAYAYTTTTSDAAPAADPAARSLN
jgi:hypothetical protein